MLHQPVSFLRDDCVSEISMAFHWHNPRVINDLNDIGLIKVRVAQDSDEKTQSVFVSIRHFAWPSIV